MLADRHTDKLIAIFRTALQQQPHWSVSAYCGTLTRSFLMKSLPWSDIPRKLSSSNFQSHRRTLCSVSWSSLPANGDRPLNLRAPVAQL